VNDAGTIDGEPLSPAQARAFAVTMLAYGLLHHVGALPSFEMMGSTRWTDWPDLLTPYAVLVPAAVTLLSAGAGLRPSAVYLVGAVMYADGQVEPLR
jgi:hypothetical protein